MNKKSKEITKNAATYSQELKWLNEVINIRLEKHFSNESFDIESIPPPIFKSEDSMYASLLTKHKLNKFERLIIISSMAHVFSPNTFDKFLIKNKGLDKRFTEFGGKIDDKN